MDEVLTADSSRFWPADRTRSAPTRRRSTSSSCATGSRRSLGQDRAGAEAAGRRRREDRRKYQALERLTGQPLRKQERHD
jgi:phosphoribosylaminoimidazole-succinocarboxamide synthase